MSQSATSSVGVADWLIFLHGEVHLARRWQFLRQDLLSDEPVLAVHDAREPQRPRREGGSELIYVADGDSAGHKGVVRHAAKGAVEDRPPA